MEDWQKPCGLCGSENNLDCFPISKIMEVAGTQNFLEGAFFICEECLNKLEKCSYCGKYKKAPEIEKILDGFNSDKFCSCKNSTAKEICENEVAKLVIDNKENTLKNLFEETKENKVLVMILFLVCYIAFFFLINDGAFDNLAQAEKIHKKLLYGRNISEQENYFYKSYIWNISEKKYRGCTFGAKLIDVECLCINHFWEKSGASWVNKKNNARKNKRI